MSDLLYYAPGIETISKRKHLLFLQKSNFIINKATTLEELKKKLLAINPIAVILNDETTIFEVLPYIAKLPLIVLSKSAINISETMSSLPNIDNIIFIRTEEDPIDSVLETVRLIASMNKEKKVS